MKLEIQMAKSRRAKKQIKESDPKMGFVGRPNKALALEFKRPIWSQIGENRMGEREKKRGGRGRREEEEGEPSQKGMETHLVYESYEIWHGSLVL